MSSHELVKQLSTTILGWSPDTAQPRCMPPLLLALSSGTLSSVLMDSHTHESVSHVYVETYSHVSLASSCQADCCVSAGGAVRGLRHSAPASGVG